MNCKSKHGQMHFGTLSSQHNPTIEFMASNATNCVVNILPTPSFTVFAILWLVRTSNTSLVFQHAHKTSHETNTVNVLIAPFYNE